MKKVRGPPCLSAASCSWISLSRLKQSGGPRRQAYVALKSKLLAEVLRFFRSGWRPAKVLGGKGAEGDTS
jgi:hypothetical protein